VTARAPSQESVGTGRFNVSTERRERPGRDDATFAAVLLCFALSGMAALVYETAWLRQFSIVFGTSELAVATVLAAYMAGLALGAVVAGRFVTRVRRPVLIYGLLELGIGLSALAVPAGIALTRHVHVTLVGGRPMPPDAGGLLQPLFYALCAFAIVGIPTAFMGATLPMLTRHVIHRREQIGGRVGLLYATNTAGAVLGTLLAAFWLLPGLGLHRTVLVGAGINGLVFLIAARLARRPADALSHPHGERRDPATTAARAGETAHPAGAHTAAVNGATRRDTVLGARPRWILPLMLLSGATSFTYEVLWTRLLSHVVGGSIYAFASMLASFLTGIAIGSAVASRLARTREGAALGFVLVQAGTALLSITIYQVLDGLPGLVGLAAAGGGPGTGLAGGAAVAAGVLLPATLCIGATFPFAVRILADDEHDAGPALARVYGWNTVGAIAGAMLAAFAAIPGLGFPGTAQLAVAANLSLALGACLLWCRRPTPLLATATLAAAMLLWFRPAVPETLLRNSPLSGRPSPGRLLYAGVGRSATVLVLEQDGLFKLWTNGLPEATIAPRGAPPPQSAELAQRWLSALPVLARPQARSVLIIGFGGGVAVEGVPPSVDAIDGIELEPKVIEANALLSAARIADPLGDPRLRIVFNDARSALALTTRRYDVIVSQPSHPWTAGASHLYTREFIAQARDHLRDRGVFVQWISAGIVDAELLKTVGATLLDVFDHVRLYRPAPLDLIFLASAAPLEVEREMARTGAPLASSRDHYRWLGVNGVNDVAAALALDHPGVVDLCGAAAVNTDDYNRLAARSPGALRSPLGEAGADDLLQPFDPLADPESALYGDPATGIDRVYLAYRLANKAMVMRAARVADAIPDAARRLLAQGLVRAAVGDRAHAERLFQQALEHDPGDDDARFALVQLWLQAAPGAPLPPRVAAFAAALGDPEAAVLEGLRRLNGGDLHGLGALDARLATAVPTDLCYQEAARLRVSWRIGDPVGTPSRATLAQEALGLIDPMLALFPHAQNFHLRAQAALAADEPAAFVETASVIARAYTDYLVAQPGAPASTRHLLGRSAADLAAMLTPLLEDGRISRLRVEEVLARLEAVSRSAGSAGGC
jgi:spermidine synthase